MKKLFLLFALLCAPAFGQVYSEQAMQNTQGNWLKSLPGALVYLCNSSAVTTDCLSGIGPLVTLYTDQTLTVSGSNPVTADSNGNYTLFTFPGIYLQCVKGATSFCQMIQIGGNGVVSCANALNGSLAAFTSTTNLSCDRLMGTDFAGNGFAQSWRYLGPVNGFFTVIGGAADPGTVPAYKLGANSVRAAAPATVGTSYYWHWPATRCAVGQAWQVVSQSTDANGDPHDFYGCFTPGSGVTFQTNGITNADQTFLDLVQGTNCTVTNTSAGHVTVTCAGGVTPTQISTPTAPTLTVNGTPGSTTICYKVVGNQGTSGGTSYLTAASGQTCTTTANGTLSSSNSVTLSAYGDTLYGPRCYDIYRVSTNGTSPTTTGKIASCVWKKFVDTGLAGDSSTAPTTNNTQLWPNPRPQPGCNIAFGQLADVDAPPCSPNSFDDEFSDTFGIADTNDPLAIWVNQNGSTANLTNGYLEINKPNTAGDNLSCIVWPVPGSTPWAFTTYLYNNTIQADGASNQGFALYEQATGKLIVMGPHGSSVQWQINKFTNTTTFSASYLSGNMVNSDGMYYEISDDGTNLKWFTSNVGWTYEQQTSQLVNNFFTTAPSHIGYCISANGNAHALEIDFLRRIQ